MSAIRRLAARAKHRLPEPLAAPVRRGLDAVDDATVDVRSRRAGISPPIPPRRLRARVGEPRVAPFIDDGGRVADVLRASSSELGRDLENAGRVLDLGCGCGRTLRHLLGRGESEWHGCDVDGKAIEWMRDTYPTGRFVANGFRPPLPFDDDTFDVVYAVSVFTHLPAGAQAAWAKELARVLGDDGVALVSTHGGGLFERPQWAHITAEQRRTFVRDGYLFVAEPRARSEDHHLGVDVEYGLSFQTAQWTRDVVKPALVIERHWPEHINWRQDLYALRCGARR